MLATQLNHLIADGKVAKHGVVELGRYICNTVGDRHILIVLDADVVVQDTGAEIGNPTTLLWPAQGADAAAAAAPPV